MRAAIGVWAVIVLVVVAAPVHGQKAGQAPAVPAAPAAPVAAQTPASTWTSSCNSRTRAAAVDCAAEQTLIKNDTRQLVARVSVRVPGETRVPVVMIQLPLGLYLPDGIDVHVDQGKPSMLPVQSCDEGGCYVGAPLAKDLLAQFQSGTTLHVTFQNLSRTKIDLTMPLAGFAAAYAGIQ